MKAGHSQPLPMNLSAMIIGSGLGLLMIIVPLISVIADAHKSSSHPQKVDLMTLTKHT